MKRSHFAFAFVLVPFLSWSQAAQPDFGSAQDEAVTFLRDLARMDTSDPPGSESQAADYIQRVFQKEGSEKLNWGSEEENRSTSCCRFRNLNNRSCRPSRYAEALLPGTFLQSVLLPQMLVASTVKWVPKLNLEP
jgi:hypothetical protein